MRRHRPSIYTYRRGMRGIGACIAASIMLAIGQCTSYDPRNMSRATSGAITSTIETSTIEAKITVMDMTTIDMTTMTTIDTTTSSEHAVASTIQSRAA